MSEFQEARREITERELRKQQLDAEYRQFEQARENESQQYNEVCKRNFNYLVPLIPNILSEANRIIFDGKAKVILWHRARAEYLRGVGSETSDGYPTIAEVPERIKKQSCQITIPKVGAVEVYYPTHIWNGRTHRIRMLQPKKGGYFWVKQQIITPTLYIKSVKKESFKGHFGPGDQIPLGKTNITKEMLLTEFKEILASHIIGITSQ